MLARRLSISVTIFALIATLLPAFAGTAAASSTVVVKASNTNGWAVTDSAAGGSYSFVADATAPSGMGALQLTTDATNAAKLQYGHAESLSLASVTELSYYTKRNAGPSVAAASFQLPVLLQGDSSKFATLVFEAYWNNPGPGAGTVPAGWTSWDVDAGYFWSTNTRVCSSGGTTNGAGGPPLYTLAQIESMCPGTVVLGIGVKVGSYNPNYDVEVDLVSLNGQAYDFEPETPCTTDCYVAPSGSDANSGNSGDPKLTIQAAINQVSPGGTVHVAAGTYNEALGASNGVTLLGPNAGVSPNTGSRVAEAIISGGNPAFRINTTDPVTIDGFTFTGGFPFIDSYTAGNKPTIQNNIFTGSGDGFFLASPDLVTFHDNYLHDISGCGSCEGLFIAGNWNGTTGTIASITDNVWSNLDSAAMNLSSVKGTISGNQFSYVTYYGALLANATNVDVTGNIFDHIINPNPAGSATWGAGVRFYTPMPGMGARITGNTFSDNYIGISVRAGGDITGLGVYAHQNSFTGNGSGLLNAGTGTFDGTCNWWNSASGPSGGDPVSGPVAFAPWLLTSNLNGPCVGNTANGTKQTILNELQALPSTGNKNNDKKIAEAIDHLQKSLDSALWVTSGPLADGNHLNAKKGDKVFEEEKETIHKLGEIKNPSLALAGMITSWTNSLVTVDRNLAQTAIDGAAGGDAKKLAEANKEMAEAQKEVLKGNLDGAIDHYKNAWKKAQEAI